MTIMVNDDGRENVISRYILSDIIATSIMERAKTKFGSITSPEFGKILGNGVGEWTEWINHRNDYL